MTSLQRNLVLSLAALLLACTAGGNLAWAEESGGATAPKPLLLIDLASPDAGKQVQPGKGNPKQSAIAVDKTGISVSFPRPQPGDADHPCIHVVPATGKAWDLSPYGHVEAKVVNTSDKKFDVIMHVVDEGVGFWTERNMEWVGLKPGETNTVKVVFGYQKGFKPGPALKASSVSEIYIYLWGKDQARSFRVEEIKAAGRAGEKPPGAGPNATAVKP